MKLQKLVAMFFLLHCPMPLLAEQTHDDGGQTVGKTQSACYDLNVLFDPDISPHLKQSHLTALEAEAEAGSVYSRYLLGAFYRLGDKHPAKVLARNISEAKTYLSNAAVGGIYAAMASMAELELQDKNYREAMLWAQVYAYFSKEEARQYKFKSNFAYQADLLKRVIDKAEREKKPIVDAEFLVDFDNFFKIHGESIQAHHQTGKHPVNDPASDANAAKPVKFACTSAPSSQAKQDPVLRRDKKLPVSMDAYNQMQAPGYAFYLLSIDQNGDVAKAVVVDSLPDERYGNALMDTVKKMKFNKSKRNEMRQAYLPMTFDDYSIQLKKRH